jgi:hypothetical protein
LLHVLLPFFFLQINSLILKLDSLMLFHFSGQQRARQHAGVWQG